MTLNIFVLRKNRRVFKLCHYFIVFLSISGAVSVKKGGNRLLVSNNLMVVTVCYSANGFFILVLCVFIFSKIFDHNCIFYEFILFPCQFTIFLTSPIKKKLSKENAQHWKKAYLDMLIVFVE